MISQLGKTITVNNILRQALITNTELEQNYDDKWINTLYSLNRGDIIIYNNTKYLIISEQNDKRYNKYKVIMRRVPFTSVFSSSNLSVATVNSSSLITAISAGTQLQIKHKLLITIDSKILLLSILKFQMGLQLKYLQIRQRWNIKVLQQSKYSI